jgi:hypothetical protein
MQSRQQSKWWESQASTPWGETKTREVETKEAIFEAKRKPSVLFDRPSC